VPPHQRGQPQQFGRRTGRHDARAPASVRPGG
jgi:hypothetical protein